MSRKWSDKIFGVHAHNKGCWQTSWLQKSKRPLLTLHALQRWLLLWTVQERAPRPAEAAWEQPEVMVGVGTVGLQQGQEQSLNPSSPHLPTPTRHCGPGAALREGSFPGL